jgi:hypothetical protein
MGENYLEEQARNAKKRRDRSRENLEHPRLFERPDIVEMIYEGVPSQGEQFREDETLRAVPSANGGHIDILRINKQVGIIEGDGARKLQSELSKPENGGIVPVKVTKVSPLSGGADLRIVQG